jgi:AcrR family transcriptional regulator
MARALVKTKHWRKPSAVRVGRPPREAAGEVDKRILNAARHVFIERGLAGASIDEIARLARAGKPTIYARFPTKEALFAAVGLQKSTELLASLESEPPCGDTLAERLTAIGVDMLERLMVPEVIDFMRLCAAEARRFPDLAIIGQTARESAAKAVMLVLSEPCLAQEIRAYPALAADRRESTTRIFLDLIVARSLLNAIMGQDPLTLRIDLDAQVKRSVAFFLAGCREESEG